MDETRGLTVREAGGAGIIDIKGDLNASAEEALSNAFSRAAEAGVVVVLNFEGLEYMNSSGIGLLVTLLIRANRQKKRLVICGLTEHYRHIFQITRLDDAITIFATEDDALASVK
ncbi:MAG TPA: STAS domain-containing protein [Chloroflexota bacterium]|jgi:anti-sigma B factor antagonist|nr:STAS domain-containing protein [Chloroflexota bacterium]